jgi:hypothetical protein
MTREEQVSEIVGKILFSKWTRVTEAEVLSFRYGVEWADANPNPARESAIQKMVETLDDIMNAALKGDETSTELNCHHLAQDALEAWKKVNND